MPSDERAEVLGRKLRGEPVCAFTWPDGVHGSRRMCCDPVVGARDGSPACAYHMHDTHEARRAAMGLEPEHMGYDDAE